MLSKSDIIQTFPAEVPDKELLATYLASVAKNSWKTFGSVKSSTLLLYSIASKSITELTFDDVDSLRDAWDARDVKKSTKDVTWGYCGSYYYWARRRLRIERDVWDYKPKFHVGQRDVKKVQGQTPEVIPDDEMDKIEVRARMHGIKWLVIFLLFKTDSPRGGEILSTRVENVDLENGLFVTGLENGNKKSNKPLLFFIDDSVKPKLAQYMLTLKPGETWLFPSEGSVPSRFGYMTSLNSVRKILGVKTHRFRKTLITKRIDMGCPDHVSELLVNHEISSVEYKHYYKKELKEKRELFDRWNPWV